MIRSIFVHYIDSIVSMKFRLFETNTTFIDYDNDNDDDNHGEENDTMKKKEKKGDNLDKKKKKKKRGRRNMSERKEAHDLSI